MLNKKRWVWAGLMPLISAPVAVVASCSSTNSDENASAAQKMANSLSASNVKLTNNNEVFTNDMLDGFKEAPADFTNKLTINAENAQQFNISVKSFDWVNTEDAAVVKALIVLSVKNKDNEQDVKDSAQIDLGLKYQQPSQIVKDKIVAVKAAYVKQSLKLKDNLPIKGAGVQALMGLAGLETHQLNKINIDVLAGLFDGFDVVKGDGTTIKATISSLTVKDVVLKDVNLKDVDQSKILNLAIKYTDLSDQSSATTEVLEFVLKFDKTIEPSEIWTIFKVFVDKKLLKFNAQSYREDAVNADNLLSADITNFEAIKPFLANSSDISYSVEDFNGTSDSAKTERIIKFKLGVVIKNGQKVVDSNEVTLKHLISK